MTEIVAATPPDDSLPDDFDLSTIITNFGTLFNKTNGTKRDVLGIHGEVFLKFGREVIARF